MLQDESLARFCDVYHQLDKNCTERLYEIYTEDIRFRDPLHHVEGITALKEYFDAMYKNVTECRFTFHDGQRHQHRAFVTWTLSLAHPRLAGGRSFTVEGCSHLTFAADGSDRVCEHRDYFDAGELLYERLPVLGRLIRRIRQRAAD
ncbi:nuclear transport factor 2 family protein [Halomonas halmophila]|uniref:Transcriptional regulator n=1 Tax=Halomonas halmophila TaxID=252 RepID=A0A4Y4F1X1_9GAMM|nr:nuclear transport factor 2 family protein [Halomonas halmophila]GED23366.1 transcriptional regulator [Halomonas halmophila]